MLSAIAQTDRRESDRVIVESIGRSYRMECCCRGGMRCVLWPTKSISVNEKCNNHGIQMKESNTVIPARYEVLLFDNVLFPQLNTSLLVK